jgi:hypothetical protein
MVIGFRKHARKGVTDLISYLMVLGSFRMQMPFWTSALNVHLVNAASLARSVLDLSGSSTSARSHLRANRSLEIQRDPKKKCSRRLNILKWALFKNRFHSYYPGVFNTHGPDDYGLNMGDALNVNIPFNLVSPNASEPEPTALIFGLMREAALYINVLK